MTTRSQLLGLMLLAIANPALANLAIAQDAVIAPPADEAPPAHDPDDEGVEAPEGEPEVQPEAAPPVAAGQAAVIQPSATPATIPDVTQTADDETPTESIPSEDPVEAPTPEEDDDWLDALELEAALFGEDEHPEDVTDEWKLTFHGYTRMGLRFHGAAERPPYLVDADYFLSGFNYTRVNEREWAELFVGAQQGRTRFVVGLFASQFSDWSETTIQGQGGIATAFVEHTAAVSEDVELGARAGMFWDRYGYLEPYDTYLFGRTHIAGLRGSARLYDRFYLKTGFGAHADVVSSNQGFTPIVWASGGMDLGWLDVGLHAFHVWTSDSEREFAIIEDGSLTVLGADARLVLDHVGELYLGVAHYDADQVLFLANGLELLHSTGGRGLTENFFGLNSENGTGSALVGAFQLSWQPARTLAAIAGRDTGRAVRGLEVRMFALTTRVQSEQSSVDPLENRNDRTYFKWGSEVFYRPAALDWFFAGLRYDRVVLDTDHDSMTYRIVSPRVGVTPAEGIDVYAQYSRYAYGDNVSLRPNQIPGDVSVTTPDGHAFKLQAQAAW